MRWWTRNKREYPWRETNDPYEVLVSEVFLHRTRAEQAATVFSRFIEKYPTAKDLASATESDIVDMMRPLGLFWRAKLLHRMSKAILEEHEGQIPEKQADLLQLPGVSHYIAATVGCFAYGRPEVLLDTNTVRILGRVFGEAVNDSSRRSKHFHNLYSSLMDKKNPREFNYAMLDLGALVCTPHNPRCHVCPVTYSCNYASLRVAAQ